MPLFVKFSMSKIIFSMAINIFLMSKIILAMSLILLAMEFINFMTANNILASEKLHLVAATINRKQYATAQEKAHLQSTPPNAKPKIAKELFPFPLLPTLKKIINFLHSNPKDQPCRKDGTAYNKSFARLRGKVLNSSLLLIFELWCLNESFGLFSPQPRKAPKRCKKCFDNRHEK
jgi:hypothetical protein